MDRSRFASLIACLLCAAPAAFAAGIPIRGRVLDADGAPLPGVRVRLVPIVSVQEAGRLELAGKDGPDAVASTESGADGGFRLEAPETGMWRVVAGGGGTDRLVPLMAQAAPLLDELDLPAVRLRREGAPTARIAPNAAWQALPVKNSVPASPGVLLRALGPDGKPVVLEVASTTVRVVSAADGRPLPGALAWIASDLGAFRRTDARGEVRFPVPGEMTVDGWAASRGFLPAPADLRSATKRPGKPLTVSLQPDLALTGVVVAENGTAVQGAEITMSPVGVGSPRMAIRRRLYGEPDVLVRSGPDGRFRWSGLEPGLAVELRVVKEGFAPSRVETVSPSPPSPGTRPAAPLRIVLRRGASAFGLVLGADRRPIQGAQVTLRSGGSSDPRVRFRAALERGRRETFEAVTGADGRFDLAHLPPGRYDLTAKGRGWAPLTVPGLDIPEGNLATDLGTLALARGAVLEGAVVDAAGKPVEGAEIHLEEAGGPMVPIIARLLEESSERDALSGPDGSFRIEDLRAGRPVDLSILQPGFALGSAEGVQVPAEPPLRIILQKVGSLSGRVVDPDGRPIAGANVQVEGRVSGRGGFRAFRRGESQSGSADSEGRFRIADVIPGPVSLSARANGWQNGSVKDLELRGGEEKSGIEIILSPAAVLEGRVLSSSGQPVEEADVRPSFENHRGEFQSAWTDAEGHYVLDRLSPGLRIIEAAHPEHGTARRQIELRVGKSSLDITLEGGREVSGRVVDDTGAPVDGADILLASGRIWGRPPTTQSRSDGSFRFPVVEEGSHQVSANKEGFAGGESVPFNVEGSSVTGLEIRLTRGGSIAGRITGVEMADLSLVRIMARGRGMPSGGQIDAGGSYRIDHLAAGEWEVRAELPGTGLHAEGRVRLEPGASEARLDLEMEQGLELSGRVRRGGAPASGMTVVLDGPQGAFADTDADGRFRFQGLSAGTYNLRVGDSQTRSRHQETVELQADRDITIDLPVASPGFQPGVRYAPAVNGFSSALLP